jgi:hypothetical protein
MRKAPLIFIYEIATVPNADSWCKLIPLSNASDLLLQLTALMLGLLRIFMPPQL